MNGLDDAAFLASASFDDPIEILYRAKRLLQINGSDADALQKIRALRLPPSPQRKDTEIFHELLAHARVRESLVRTSVLLEREEGAFLCRRGDSGATMFFILRGALAGYMQRQPDIAVEKPSFTKLPGELIGELAFVLKQPRTATIVCSHGTALLALTYEDLVHTARLSRHESVIRQSLDYTVNMKIIEMVCHRKDFLVGEQSNGPLSAPAFEAPWIDLEPHARVRDISWREKASIDASELPKGRGVCLLVGGSVIGPGKQRITSETCPILFAEVADTPSRPSLRFELESDVKLVVLDEDGLLAYGKPVFRAIAERVKNEVSVSVAEYGGDANLTADRTSQRFFISFTSSDRSIAEWIAWTLAEEGHEVAIYTWELPAGGSIPQWMIERLAWADRVIAVVSPEYTRAAYSRMEWVSTIWRDPAQSAGVVIPVIVRPTPHPPPLLNTLKQIDLTKVSELEARERLLAGVRRPLPPARKPAFDAVAPEQIDRQPPTRPEFVNRDNAFD